LRATTIFIAALLTACTKAPEPPPDSAALEFQKQLQTQLITAKPGDVITIPAGVHRINRGLSLNVSGVTIRGEGMDRSILSFRDQVQGAEGLLVNASDFTIEDLAIEDAAGDGLKVNEGRNIVIRRVRAEWTNGPDEKNGAYGIYPVQTTNLLLEECVAIGASDAGLYVGQSDNVIVRNNRAEFNVAGIEIENTRNADVYGNTATNNTGGILVFNMPDLPVPGHSTRVYGNTVVGNNTGNFGAEGTPVASVPAGSGIGGGSADAAAALRGLSRLWSLDLPPAEMAALALTLGADVPVCLDSRPVVMSGIGEVLEPVPALPPLWFVLVNPGVAVSTAQVFAGREGAFARVREPRLPPLALTALIDWLAARPNDLEAPARRLAPAVDGVLSALAEVPDCLLARMSGSGATCFGLFEDKAAARRAAEALALRNPDWWVVPALVRA